MLVSTATVIWRIAGTFESRECFLSEITLNPPTPTGDLDGPPLLDKDYLILSTIHSANRLPIHVGIPGPASIKTLLDYARICGIGPSVRGLPRRAGGFARLALEATPERIVADLARFWSMDPDCGIVRAHVFPFGGLARASAWLSVAGR